MLRPAPLALAFLLVAATAAAPTSAQAHEHGAMDAGIAIAHDAPADGRTYVGNVNHFAVIAHGDDEVPDFHQDIPWRVTLNGLTLVETTAVSGHDYDGVNAFDIVFPAEGTYLVEALDAEGKVAASFGGTVLPAPALLGIVTLEAPSGPVLAGQPATFTYWVSTDGGDVPTAHSDCTFEALRGPRLEFRAKSHTHEDKQVATYAFADQGEYRVRVTCFQAYASPRATLFVPAVAEASLMVLPGVPANAGAAPPASPPPPSELNAVVVAPAGEGMTLVGTFDPYTIVGPDTLQHLDVLAVDATGQTIQHVDFTAVLDGPAGQVFRSETLHEYDGILEFTARQATPGPYTLRVTAEGASGSGELAMTYVVAPRAVPLNAGVVGVALEAPSPVSGTPSQWTLASYATSGPFAHGELDLRLTQEGQTVPFLQAKLHTHADGRFPFTVALPEAGKYTLDVLPFPLMAELVVLPEPASFTIEAAAGPALPLGESGAATAEQESPGPGALVALGGLAALALALRRRRA
jgi:uncharacterized protein (TIGR03382 family)